MTARKAWAAVAAKSAAKRPRTVSERSKAVRRPSAHPQTVLAPSTRSKYGAVRTGKYASKKEAKRAAELKLLEKAGKVQGLREQQDFELIPKQVGERSLSYRADFVYEEVSEDDKGLIRLQTIVEDCKGYRTPEYRLKRKLMLFLKGIRIRET